MAIRGSSSDIAIDYSVKSRFETAHACKGLTFPQRVQRHLFLLQNTELPLKVRRQQRRCLLRMISNFAKRTGLPIETVLSFYHLSREDLKVSKNK